jgi:hypothetical protein
MAFAQFVELILNTAAAYPLSSGDYNTCARQSLAGKDPALEADISSIDKECSG